jgi:hypothetical protein
VAYFMNSSDNDFVVIIGISALFVVAVVFVGY